MTVAVDTQFDDFFALFKQPIQFKLAQNELDERLRHLQKQYHPDNVEKSTLQGDTDTAKAIQQAEQASAIINQAYQTLSHLDSRAAYLLDIAGQAETLENSIADLDFLEDAMQLRIDLDDAIDDKDNATLKHLQPQIAKRLQNQSERFDNAYTNQDWPQAIDATQKLKFLVKLNADITTAIDDVAKSDQTDDDLYV
ncbi:Fe-S protein assembly co-chaperone HscB [Psychrobacter sp. M13]|uniref:Fe-S protein assembly co-chaperone HscB n=1 Tax=Psychrobacter sp. M13 TaxID=3067275 RepID=UPI00273C57AD|nr:Fe-S protein assembly co-chaperone HscB [Psychrobacter sp. M13]WLP95421.1 Fe-S protein assembly co-chaperone HscB [Psychrobacter sp. M13]